MTNLIKEARELCEVAQNLITDEGAPREIWLAVDKIPALCDALQRTEAELKEWRTQCGKMIDLAGSWKEASDGYLVEVLQLRKSVAWIPVTEKLP